MAWQNEQERQKEYELTRQREKDGYFRFADRLEIILDDYLTADEGIDYEIYSRAIKTEGMAKIVIDIS